MPDVPEHINQKFKVKIVVLVNCKNVKFAETTISTLNFWLVHSETHDISVSI